MTDSTSVPSRGAAEGLGALAFERTPIGDQSLVFGVAPITARDRLAFLVAAPLLPRRPQRAPDHGLFDLAARNQLDLFQPKDVTMDLLTPGQRAALLRNAEIAAREAESETATAHDPVPVVKFFNPCGAATWLATELDPDSDTLFGLADLGFGCPELGSFSLIEIASVRLPFGLGIERDLDFAGGAPLSTWAELARRTGSIIGAEAILRRNARRAAPATSLGDPAAPSGRCSTDTPPDPDQIPPD